jgi:hypothetical protein
MFPDLAHSGSYQHFNILCLLCRYGVVTIVPNQEGAFVIQNWKDRLGDKYTGLSGIQKLHDFRATIVDGEAFLEVKQSITQEEWKVSLQKVNMVHKIIVTNCGY